MKSADRWLDELMRLVIGGQQPGEELLKRVIEMVQRDAIEESAGRCEFLAAGCPPEDMCSTSPEHVGRRLGALSACAHLAAEIRRLKP